MSLSREGKRERGRTISLEGSEVGTVDVPVLASCAVLPVKHLRAPIRGKGTVPFSNFERSCAAGCSKKKALATLHFSNRV
jgi:hypothetical protein